MLMHRIKVAKAIPPVPTVESVERELEWLRKHIAKETPLLNGSYEIQVALLEG